MYDSVKLLHLVAAILWMGGMTFMLLALRLLHWTHAAHMEVFAPTGGKGAVGCKDKKSSPP